MGIGNKISGRGVLLCSKTKKSKGENVSLFWCTQSNTDICSDPLIKTPYPIYIMIDDHGSDGNQINGIIDATDKGIGVPIMGLTGSMDRLYITSMKTSNDIIAGNGRDLKVYRENPR